MSISRRLPNTDEGRNRALNTSKNKNDSLAPADRFLTAPTQTRLNTQQPLLNTAMADRAVALANQSGSTTLVEGAKSRARMFESHFIQVFNLGVSRGLFPAGHRAYYQLDVNSESVPLLTSEQDITLWGQRIVNGDAARLAAGGAAMANPAVADVGAAVTTFNTENTSQSTLKDAYDTAQQAVEAMRPENDAVIKKIWDEVETFYNEEEPSSKRRKAREWGVVYVSDIKLTFNIRVADSANGNALQNVLCELVETGITENTSAGGTVSIESTISDLATFRFSLADYITQQVEVDLTTGETTFTLSISLVHV